MNFARVVDQIRHRGRLRVPSLEPIDDRDPAVLGEVPGLVTVASAQLEQVTEHDRERVAVELVEAARVERTSFGSFGSGVGASHTVLNERAPTIF